MDITNIMTAIQGVGFPIVAFIMVYKTSHEQNDKWIDKITDLTKSLAELTETVKNQTEILMSMMSKGE